MVWNVSYRIGVTLFLAKPSHSFAYLCLDIVKIFLHAKFD